MKQVAQNVPTGICVIVDGEDGFVVEDDDSFEFDLGFPVAVDDFECVFAFDKDFGGLGGIIEVFGIAADEGEREILLEKLEGAEHEFGFGEYDYFLIFGYLNFDQLLRYKQHKLLAFSKIKSSFKYTYTVQIPTTFPPKSFKFILLFNQIWISRKTPK